MGSNLTKFFKKKDDGNLEKERRELFEADPDDKRLNKDNQAAELLTKQLERLERDKGKKDSMDMYRTRGQVGGKSKTTRNTPTDTDDKQSYIAHKNY